MNNYFDIIHNPRTGRIAIDLGQHMSAVTYENADRVNIIQEAGGLIMIDKKVLLDLADFIRSQEG